MPAPIPARPDPKPVADPALALAGDRSASHAVLFQRQGEISGALLPQWLSGYAFLFSAGQRLVAQLVPGSRTA